MFIIISNNQYLSSVPHTAAHGRSDMLKVQQQLKKIVPYILKMQHGHIFMKDNKIEINIFQITPKNLSSLINVVEDGKIYNDIAE